jgi:hypothetical protein
LKLVTVLAFFTELGIMFQSSIARLEKKFLLISNLAAFCLRFRGQSETISPLSLQALSPASFEDKRRENWEAGQQELQKRR